MDMSRLLEQALERVGALSPEEQDAIDQDERGETLSLNRLL
jgi:hypothetical protein